MIDDGRMQKKNNLIITLTNYLPVLRASLGISQGELAEFIGISRQTYCALEVGKREMGWNTFLALFLFFVSNDASNSLLNMNDVFIEQVHTFLQFESVKNMDQHPKGNENNLNRRRRM